MFSSSSFMCLLQRHWRICYQQERTWNLPKELLAASLCVWLDGCLFFQKEMVNSMLWLEPTKQKIYCFSYISIYCYRRMMLMYVCLESQHLFFFSFQLVVIYLCFHHSITEAQHSDTNSQLCIQHLLRKLGCEPYIGQRIILPVSQRISVLAETLLFSDPFDEMFPAMHECMFVM